MTTYDFNYKLRNTRGVTLMREAPRHIPERGRGIVLPHHNPTNAYFYDLSTRHPLGAGIKRAVDILISTAVIALLAPVFLLLGVLIKLTSPGKIMFRQRRIGFRGNQFMMYKFRTMYSGAHLQEKELAAKAGGSFLKLKNDPRITPIGRLLRKYSLDELPQLFNVLEGTMSMVGPRPLLPSDLDTLPRRGSLPRFCMPPGITGLWQVAGRSDCSEIKRMRFDREYFDRWSLSFDFEILLRTIGVVIVGRGAV